MPTNNLPAPLDCFIGREKEIAAVIRLTAQTRLLTLTGAGGCGKTRLALEVATRLTDSFEHGVAWVELAPLNDLALVPHAVAQVFDVRESTNQPLTQTLASYLRSQQCLLILDNCEHLITACAHLAETLLRACPQLFILTTSREALNVAGETAWRVPPLEIPNPATTPPEALLTAESTRLFIDRAGSTESEFVANSQNTNAIAQICYRLDGMPLAIELAAARVKSLSVEQIATRLDDRFRLLNLGSRTAPLRHQTLRAVVDWSYGLLSPSEKILFRRLAIFVGGWALEAAEAICRGGGLASSEILDVLARLVDKSLVIAQNDLGRYRMLETIRQYAREKLIETNELQSLQAHHCDYFVQLAEEAEPKLKGPGQKVWSSRLETEYNNLRTAWDWSIEHDTEIALRLAWSLLEFWGGGWHLPEAREWLTRLLPHTEQWGVSPNRARALILAGAVASYQRDYIDACQMIKQGLAIAEKTESKFEIASGYSWLAFSTFFLNNFQSAHDLLEASIVLWREVGDELSVARAQFLLANVTRDQGQFELAQQLYEESISKFQALGNNRHLASVLNSMGELARLQGDYPRAIKLYEKCIRLERENGRKFILALAIGNLASVLLRRGDYIKAREFFEECLKLEQQLGRQDMVCLNLTGLAGVLSATAQSEQAARLLGLIEVIINDSNIIFQRADRIEYEFTWASVRARLDEVTFEKFRAEGRGMTLNQAIEFGLTRMKSSDASDSRTLSLSPRQAAKEKFGGLTAREREVAKLIAQGKTNHAIAEALVLSERTIEDHVGNILNKLGFDARTQIAVWAVQKGLVQNA